MNSTSIMPPRSCLRSNRSLSFGWPSRSRSRIDSTSPRSFASSLGIRSIARAESRPRERLVLPGPGRFALIATKGVDRADEEPAPAFGAQAQVDVEENARGSAAGDPAGEALREARVDFRRPVVRIVVKKDQVEIGRVAQFLSAEL